MFISEADPQAATVAHLRAAEEAGRTSFNAFWIRKDGTVGKSVCSSVELMFFAQVRVSMPMWP
jgi:hypothetical protein